MSFPKRHSGFASDAESIAYLNKKVLHSLQVRDKKDRAEDRKTARGQKRFDKWMNTGNGPHKGKYTPDELSDEISKYR
jgi:hypothetical protein